MPPKTFIQIPRPELQRLIQTYGNGVIPVESQAEMAIPSYLHSNPAVRWLFWKRYKVLFEMLARRISERANILEFGCGTGVFLPNLRLLADQAPQVYAIDLFPQIAQGLVNELQIPVTFIKDLDEIPDQHLEAVVAANVLEHLENPQVVIDIFWKKLVPDGWLMVSGPTETRLYQVGRWVAGFSGMADYHHTNIIQLEKLIGLRGFTCNERRSLPLPQPLCLSRILAFQKLASQDNISRPSSQAR